VLWLSIQIVQFVANLIVAAARETNRLLACFRNKVRALPLRPGAVFRLHRIRRQLELENSVSRPGNFIQAPLCANTPASNYDQY
jgi:hypothetical protein